MKLKQHLSHAFTLGAIGANFPNEKDLTDDQLFVKFFKKGVEVRVTKGVLMSPESISTEFGIIWIEYLEDTVENGITSIDYVDCALSTESANFMDIKYRLSDSRTIRLLHSALGLVTEAAELADMLKKHIFYGKPLDDVNAKEELGDTLWYAGIAIDVLKTTMNDVMTMNIEKLKKRYPDKFTEHDALNRDVGNELSHI
jgi:NTP pyrophosphatase (non-canonical NTP hydrolase)